MTIKKGITERLSDHICSLQYDDLPAEVIQQAKKVILDAVGCQVACSRLESGHFIIKFGRGECGTPEASVLGSNFKTSAVSAALMNGTLGHGDEIDESLEQAGHTAAVIVASALACGEKVRGSGKDMISAVVSGYDMAGCLVNAGVRSSTLGSEFVTFTSVFWGVAAASNMLKLSRDKTRIALGLAACQTSGYCDFVSEANHMAKSLTWGLGARGGVTAALLAEIGYDGSQSVFDGGEKNVFKRVIGQAYNAADLPRDLGIKYTIMDTCIKLYSAGHPIHAPVDGLLKILAREHVSADQIRSIIVHQPYYEQRLVDNRDMPEINVQYCLAVAALDRQLTWDQFTAQRSIDPKVVELKKRVTSVPDPKLDERQKITKAHSAEVELETKDGRKFLERVDYPPGDPGNPASQEDVEKKVMHYASPGLGDEKTRALIKAVNRMETIVDLNELGNLLRI